MPSYRGKQVLRDGKWEPGQASPEHLREELAQLPSSFVTKDEADPDRVHDLDESHIVEALTEEQRKAEGSLPDLAPKPEEPASKKKLGQKSLFKAGTTLKLSSLNAHRRQFEIDLIRFKVIHGIINGLYQMVADGHPVSQEDFTKPRYLDFPNDNLMEFRFKESNAPANSDRPTYLVGMRLEIDLLNWPERVVDLLKEEGIQVPAPSDIYNSIFKTIAGAADGQVTLQ